MVVPKQGQLVSVRNRHYVVPEVAKSTLPPTLEQPSITSQHLLSLQSVEDDGLGEELQVIWELEPGAQLFEEIHLPVSHNFDKPKTLDAFLNAVRWGAISSADKRNLQAPFRSGIEIEDYQLDPLVRALQMPRANLLIADDVGLGKTNGYKESFSALLEVLDNQRFARGIIPPKDQLSAIMIRRLKSELELPDGTPRFPIRKLEALEVPYTDKEKDLHELLIPF